MDEDAGTWGVAVLQVQANLPDTVPGQNVTMLLFGDVEITDASTDAEVNPMQAFYFRSGVGDAPCAEAPDSGILIQTPEGAGTIELTVNEVNVTLGSTAYLQAEPEDVFTVSVLEGEGTVAAEGETQPIPAGTQVEIPIDEDLAADGVPSEAEPYDPEAFAALPLEILPREIEIAEESEAGSAEIIEIQPGTWTQTIISMSGCGIDPDMVSAMPSNTFVIESSDVEAVIRAAATGSLNVEGTEFDVTSPEPNVYIFVFSSEGTTVTSEYHIISPTFMEVSATIENSDCTIEMTAELERTGD
jgi:hypothetical protein